MQDSLDDLKSILNLLDEGRILTLSRKGGGGMHQINEICIDILRTHLIKSADMKRTKDQGNVYGTPVMIEHNDYDNNLFNGDTGILIPWGDETKAVFPGTDQPRLFSPALLKGLTPAFAITVHKSQGSEYNKVILALPDQEDHPLLARELIFTALTRARSQFICLGRTSELAKGAKNKNERETGVSPDWLD